MPNHSNSVVRSVQVWSVVRSVLIQSVGLAGLAAFIEGVRQIYTPAALIVGGALVVFWTIMKVRAT